MNLQPITDLLKALNSGNTTTIQQAEQLYADYKNHQPDQLVNSFIVLIRTSQDELLRSYPPVLLRTLVNGNDSGNILKGLKPETLVTLKTELMFAVREEPKNHIRHSILNVIAILAIQLVPEQKWPEILSFIIESSSSPEENLRESSFYLIGAIIDDSRVAETLAPHFDKFALLVEKGLNDPSAKVQVSALETVSTFIDANPEKAEVFKPLIPAMLNTIQKTIESNLEKEAQKGILTFIIIAQYHSDWFKTNFDMIFKVFFQFLEHQSLEDETKHACLHFFLTFAEFKSSIMKKKLYLEPIVLLLLKWMSSVEDMDLKDWNSLDTEPSDDDDSNVAFEAIEALSHCVSKGLWEFFLQCAPTLLNSGNWKERYTGLMTLSSISEGCEKQIKTNFKLIIQSILPLANDSHPRVRFAFFYCLGSFASYLKREMQDLYKTLIPVSLEHLNDPFPRVTISNCEFLTLFLDEIKPNRVKEFKDQFLGRLSPLLQNENYKIVQHSLNAFSSVVDGIGEEFTQHYSEIMPFLIKILRTQTSVETKTLRGRAIETISLVGLAVGKKVFLNDCIQIIQYVSSLEKFKDDDPQVDFFLRAFTRFAQCLGEDFIPYLKYSMSPLMDAINGKVDSSVENGEDFSDESNNSGSIVMENKAMALEMVSIYAMELKHHLFPYVEQLYKGSIELVDFPFSSLVAIQAVNLIPFLVKISKQHFEAVGGLKDGMKAEFTSRLFLDSYERMAASIKTESEPDTLSAKLKALSDLMDIGGQCEQADRILSLTFEVANESFGTLQELETEYQENIDEEDEDADESPEREIIDDAYNSLAMVLGEVCIQFKEKAVPYIATVLPAMIELIETAPSVEIKTSMICILDDLIENGGQKAFELYPHIIKPMMNCTLPNLDPSLIQSAVFGIGLAAENGKDYFTPFLMESLQLINNVIVSVNSVQEQDDDLIAARDNAISAMGRIITNLPQHLGNNFPQTIALWLSYLPIQDDGEAGSIIKSLCTLIRDFSQQIMTQQYIVKVLEIIAVGLHKKAVNPDDKQIISLALRSQESLVAQSLFQLSAENQAILANFFKN
ncbi:importin subunit beta-3 [Dictyostelium discoideum AX4]|uniref:Probable importin-5 homolog n=1 Tax=Dictyostelium discoideum TaxID=44689 RepID=IPO5_DICDI|nr:importin subunit beta-3 [Dictyostelium discoideum AX4]Q54EW3.1 RecName: Full=Probable importin-5 homolog; AltName: Full=Importin subunit beta-3; AltName: Full=Karyopherin beta-3 [Dictyostelium discoideum]EAL61809.1 importin subunit beta-3 [Dictyostelium discoideum AX4]|eukprot:XP_635127.1 importin subunit beta-3 [Dictyostelium discoideum AX4]